MDQTNTLTPLDTVNGFLVCPGNYDSNGASLVPGGVNFTVHSHGASSCELLLYRRTETIPYATIPFPSHYRIGYVYSMVVFGLDIENFEYAYALDGPYDPEKGQIFDKAKPLLDLYAKAVTGQSTWGKKATDDQSYRARVVKNNFNWGRNIQPLIPMEDLVIYELHVRGYTQHASSGVTHRGTFAGLMEKIPYLKELDVNAVELMPIFEFDELSDGREVDGKKLLNYWGYSTVSFFAPNTSYASAVEYNREGNELKTLIKNLNENGIEVILDVVFNHTAEGDEKGPFFSFKGFDNNIYYMLTPDGKYYNFSGCGNTLNCNHPVVQQLILECLRYWVTAYRVDGFRFDLASILGRNEDGSPMSKPPLLQSLAFDPILGKVKLIAEAWDAGGLYQVGSFPSWKRWSEWNGKYRDDMREFLKGTHWMSGTAAQRIAGSPDLYDPLLRGHHASVNFLTCHDGFTLYDLYAYNEKHNEANGWGNTDGSSDNHSWNCGVEGPAEDPNVESLRHRMMKNAFAVLMCSRGTPMFLAGDEFGNTQFGNNNPYCQDNEISWLDWTLLEKNKDIFDFFSYMAHFRHKHPVIRKALPKSICEFPEISFHSEVPWNCSFSPEQKVLCVMFSGYDETKQQDDTVYLAINVYWEPVEISLPRLCRGQSWQLAVNTGAAPEEPQTYAAGQMLSMPDKMLLKPRSAAVLVV